jgi:hypothetical protein
MRGPPPHVNHNVVDPRQQTLNDTAGQSISHRVRKVPLSQVQAGSLFSLSQILI